MKSDMTVLLLTMIGAFAACGGGDGGSQNITGPTQPLTVLLAQFTDPVSGLLTSDVRDVDEQIVRFDTNNHTLIWQADGRTFPGYTVNGNNINSDFCVRFGTKDGARRAYFTETTRPFICNIEVANGQISISATNVPVPGGG